jgi:ribulose-phosphate 3-epimerase
MSARICPSILSADFANFESELATIGESDLIHVDVMDNHFVPNLTFGLSTVARLQEISSRPLDVHLMIEDVDRWAIEYAKLGVFSVTFHAEATGDPANLAKSIRAAGSRAGMALKPATPLENYEHVVAELDQLLIMTVEPGFGGQKLIESTLDKVSRARTLIDTASLDCWLQVDGGIDAETISRAALAGADTFVAGKAVFGAEDRNLQIRTLRSLAEQA